MYTLSPTNRTDEYCRTHELFHIFNPDNSFRATYLTKETAEELCSVLNKVVYYKKRIPWSGHKGRSGGESYIVYVD